MPQAALKEKKRLTILIEMIMEEQELLVGLRDLPEVTIVILAIRLGWYQRRPMDVTALAAITNLPRTTVTRHIKALEGQNRVAKTRIGRRSVPIFTGMDTGRLKVFFDRLEAIVMHTSADLTNLDS